MAPSDKGSHSEGPSEGASRSLSARLVKAAHYAVVLLVLGAGAAYWLWKPPGLNPAADPRAAEALALVQTHRALDAPTVLQAVTDHVKRVSERGSKVRMGEWVVRQQQGDLYIVNLSLREEEGGRWFEREYQWRVNLARKRVAPLSLPAELLMPIPPPSPPAPR